MPKRIRTNLLYKVYLNITSSIALVPAVILVLLFGLAFLVLAIDHEHPGLLLSKEETLKNSLNPDSARSLLTAIATGMITLTVFTFTMVMVVLNQTASNYSPRALSMLIRGRFHQVIMGIYLGAITYTFVVLACIESGIYTFDVPILAVLINAFLSLVCLILFIAFIQAISTNIQIGNIINKIYRDTLKSLDYEIGRDHIREDELPNMDQWEALESPVSGYLDGIDHKLIRKKASQMGIKIKMLVAVGRFVNQKDPLFLVNRKIDKDEQEDIFLAFVFRHQELIKQNYIYGFKQLTEIAVKALSPAINDPGTAVQAIDRITDLFVNALEMPGYPVLRNKSRVIIFIYHPIPLTEIFYFAFSSIKSYAAGDITGIIKLQILIYTLARNDEEGILKQTLLSAIEDAIEQFTPALNCQGDKKRFMEFVEKLQPYFPDAPEIRLALESLHRSNR